VAAIACWRYRFVAPFSGSVSVLVMKRRGSGPIGCRRLLFRLTLGKRHMVTFATDQPGGFDDAHVAGLLKLLPALALVSEIRIKNRLARTLLETYVGSHAGELILAAPTGAEAGRRYVPLS
jgi:hypothetical protein